MDVGSAKKKMHPHVIWLLISKHQVAPVNRFVNAVVGTSDEEIRFKGNLVNPTFHFEINGYLASCVIDTLYAYLKHIFPLYMCHKTCVGEIMLKENRYRMRLLKNNYYMSVT